MIIMKPKTEKSITEKELQGLLMGGSIATFEAIPTDDGSQFEILINGQFYLQSQRQPRRRFSSLDTLAGYLVDRWGIETVTVHFDGWKRKNKPEN
ncbi:hypothetical protein WK27_25560 [Burkholderia vietnamiensis]|nr:hypothetical protein WJ05_21595 [Burkholderia vietnamiensis]KVF31588.1 hypothetical protein WJ09_18665 [Burkholderia vietnamiensis]KVR80596.1 hypothetical protein WK27_25560 [Burkholderia vietnamiensis]